MDAGIAVSGFGIGAEITTQQETIDCGQVLFRNPVTAEFPLKNAGNKALRISQVRKSCGCTEVEFPERDIAPGDSFMVRATFDAKQMGTFIKQIGLFSNADEQPFVLTMRGKVVDRVVDFAGNYAYQLGKLKPTYRTWSLMTSTEATAPCSASTS